MTCDSIILPKINGRVVCQSTAEDEMVGWHLRLNGHEFEQTPGDGKGQGSLACFSPWGHKESDMTWRLIWSQGLCLSTLEPPHPCGVSCSVLRYWMACRTMTEHRDSACPVSNPSLTTSVNSLSGPQLPHLSKERSGNTYLTEIRFGLSLAVQWLRLHLPVQGGCVWLIKTSKTIHNF